MYAFLVCGLLTIFLFRFANKQRPRPVFGIYQAPGKWYYLKVAFMYAILKIRKLQYLITLYRENLASNDTAEVAFETSKEAETTTAGYGIKSRSGPATMDCRQILSGHPKAIDAVYFNLSNQDGWNLVVGTAHRPKGVVDGFLYLRIPGVGLLTSPKLPDTLLFRAEETESKTSYGAEGIKLTPFMPMRTWRIQYSGKMRCDGNDTTLLDVELDAVWSSNLPMFDFDTDMDALAVAKGMAREPWSREYFHTVQDFHQTHYEQHGNLNGTAIVNKVQHKLIMTGVRDHSYGKRREWKNFHRYGLHFITLENGIRISVGVICAPIAFSRMEIGYMYTSDGNVIPVQGCNLPLEQHGENGCPPKDYAFSFQAGGKTYHVEVEVRDSPEFYVGWEWEARVVERLANFKVNGVAGWGAAEWEYRHILGRPENIAVNDPQWTTSLNKG